MEIFFKPSVPLLAKLEDAAPVAAAELDGYTGIEILTCSAG